MIRLDSPDPEDAVLRYLIDLPGVFYPHSGRTLLHHLIGTFRVLKHWCCSEDVCNAGLFHSIYGTPAFPYASLPPTERTALENVIGKRGDQLVREFSLTDWGVLFRGGIPTVRSVCQEMLLLGAANIVEQWDRLSLDGGRGVELEQLIENVNTLSVCLPPPVAELLGRELDAMRDRSRNR